MTLSSDVDLSRRSNGQSPAAPLESPLDLSASTKQSIRILVVDDEHTLRETCAGFLRDEGYTVQLCGRGEEARDLLTKKKFDIVLIDLFMSQVSGMELLGVTLHANPDTLVVLMTGNPSVETSVAGLRAGAWDYVPKPFSATHLQVLIGRAAHTVVVARESRERRDDAAEEGHSDRITLLGESESFREVIHLARKVAATDASVFLTGESGTGKELIAQFIHHNSRRSSRPLVPVNCAAIPETLLESEMFGHVEGAFTGAVREKKGLLEAASGGTLFLDELTEMPHAVQAKLLRVIQDGVVRRVGSTQTDAVVNVRFIAATNKEPGREVREGRLRKDLHYRLRVVPIHIPPLRERPEDIPLLARHFLGEFWRQHRHGEGAMPSLSDDAVDALIRRPWRGNVRELRNVIEHAVVLLSPECEVFPEDLPGMDDGEGAEIDGGLFHPHHFSGDYHSSRERVLAEFEKGYLKNVVRRGKGNISSAARIAGVDRTTLYRLMDKHGISRDDIPTKH